MTQELNPSANATPAPEAKPTKRKKALLILLGVLILAGIGFAALYLLDWRWKESTDDAYVQGNMVSVTPQTAGTVTAIAAENGMKVQSGSTLVQLDPLDATVGLETAKANLANAVRQARGLYTQISTNAADIRAKQIALANAQQDLARREGLVGMGAVSAEELSHARQQVAMAQAALSASQSNQARARTLVDATSIATQPAVEAAAAQVRQAYLAGSRNQIVAPVSGYVAQRTIQVGQRVQPGTPLMTIVPLEQVWVEANFKETQLAKMRIGQPVKVTADLYGSKVEYKGKLVSMGLGTGSAFSLLPAQNASGNWIKIVQRVPVRIELDPAQVAKYPLRIGLSMSVDVDVHDQNGPVLAAAAPEGKAVYATDAFDKQLHEANDLIAGIIARNAGR